MGKLISTIQRK